MRGTRHASTRPLGMHVLTAISSCMVMLTTVACGSPGSIPIGADHGEDEVTWTRVTGPTFINPADLETASTETEFAIRNVGASPVKIELAGKSSGCTSVEFADSVVEPGGHTRVRVKSRLPTGTGRELHNVVLAMDRGYPRTIRLNVENFRYSRLAIAPVEPVHRRIAPGSRVEEVMRVVAYQPASEPVVELSHETHGKWLSSELSRPTTRLLGGGIREVSAILTTRIDTAGDSEAAMSIGPRAGRVVVYAGKDCHLSRSMTWVPATPLEAVPDRLFVQSTGAASRGTIVLRGTEPFRILEVEASDPWLSATIDGTEVLDRHVIRVTVSPPDTQRRAREGWLRIRTSHPDQEVARVPVLLLTASGSKPASLE